MSFRAYDLAKLVEDFGETLTLRKRTTAGTYNPAPEIDDQILRGSEKVNIVHVVTAYSNGVVLHHICDVVS